MPKLGDEVIAGVGVSGSALEDALRIVNCQAIDLEFLYSIKREPEVRFSAVGPAIVMPMIIGYKKARELLYFGDQIDAKTALDLGMVNRIVPLAELREASLKFAKRLSLISPEALYATKRAVNRVADAAGFRTALYAGLDVVGPLYATTTELGARFRQIATTEGVPAAVRWRSAQFKE